MRGLELSRAFYEEYGREMLESEFGDYVDRIAVGLVGHGSECFGFDDDISKDHDFAPSFCIWLTDEDERLFGFKLFRCYSKLPRNFRGEVTSRPSLLGDDGRGVMTISDFYRRYTGTDGAPRDAMEWLRIPSFYLAEATNGEVFCDPLGKFSEIRDEIKHGMPEDARLKKLASAVFNMAQSGQYNYGRCLRHGENGAARLALSDFVKSSCEAVFLLNRAHMPYYKWSFRAMHGLERLNRCADKLEGLILIPPSESESINNTVEEICTLIIDEMKLQNLTDVGSDYLEGHAFSVTDRIKNAEIRNMYVML